VLITAKAENRLATTTTGSTPANALRFQHDDFQAGLGTFDGGRQPGNSRTLDADTCRYRTLERGLLGKRWHAGGVPGIDMAFFIFHPAFYPLPALHSTLSRCRGKLNRAQVPVVFESRDLRVEAAHFLQFLLAENMTEFLAKVIRDEIAGNKINNRVAPE